MLILDGNQTVWLKEALARVESEVVNTANLPLEHEGHPVELTEREATQLAGVAIRNLMEIIKKGN